MMKKEWIDKQKKTLSFQTNEPEQKPMEKNEQGKSKHSVQI